MARKIDNLEDFNKWMDEIGDAYMKWVEKMEKEMDLIDQYFTQAEAEAGISREIRELEQEIWLLNKE